MEMRLRLKLSVTSCMASLLIACAPWGRQAETGPTAAPSCLEGMKSVSGGAFEMSDGFTVVLDGYCIDEVEVTVRAYEECVREERCSAPATIAPFCNYGTDKMEHPINCVSYAQAA